MGGSTTRARSINITMKHDGIDCIKTDCQGLGSKENCESQKQNCNEEIECPGIDSNRYLIRHNTKVNIS